MPGDQPLRLGVFSIYPLRSFSGIPFNVVRGLKSLPGVQIVELEPQAQYRPNFLKRAGKSARRRLTGKVYLWEKEPRRCEHYSRQIDLAVQRSPVDAVLMFGSELCGDCETSVPLFCFGDSIFGTRIDLYPDQQSRSMCDESLREGAFVQQRGLDRLRKIFLTSQWAWDTAQRRFHYTVDNDKVDVVAIGANLARDPVITGAPDGNAVRFVWIGHYWERKGGDFTVDVTRALRERHPGVVLDVVGNVKPPVSEPWLHLHGPLNYDEPAGYERLARIYSTATALLLPSTGDLTPIAITEAFAFGRPVVASAVGGIPEMIEDGRTGLLVASRSVEDWQARLDLAIRNRDFERMGPQCIDAYRRRFNWSVICQRIVDSIRSATVV
jgi:glycosyltransferase involved in cell wall biosynthesis